MMKKSISFLAVSLLLLNSCKNNPTKESANFVNQLSIENTFSYLQDFQKIADENKGNRAVGTPGGIASSRYIVETLKKMGLNPVVQDFTNIKGQNGTNVIVEIKGQTDKVTMLGGHFDSVEFGPGINDNATGVAILLEMIAQITANKIVPKTTLRFAFWDSEEIQVGGSRYYVSKLSAQEKQQLVQYINIDMVGTKDPTALITDGDGSSWKNLEERFLENAKTDEEKNVAKQTIEALKKNYPKQVVGAEKLEKLYSDYLKTKNIEFKDDYLLSNNSDILPFLGVTPAIGIVMTNEKMDDAGELLYAPCYHKPCDNISNVDKKSLQIAMESIAYLLNEVGVK